MMKKKYVVRLSRKQLDYLRKLSARNALLARVLKDREVTHAFSSDIELTVEEAEILRSFFTEELASRGFGPDYSPNEEGLMLEKLIDIFYFK